MLFRSNTCTRRCMLTEWVEGLGESLALREGKGKSPTGCTAFHPACPNSHRCQAHLAACTPQSLLASTSPSCNHSATWNVKMPICVPKAEGHSQNDPQGGFKLTSLFSRPHRAQVRTLTQVRSLGWEDCLATPLSKNKNKFEMLHSTFSLFLSLYK